MGQSLLLKNHFLRHVFITGVHLQGGGGRDQIQAESNLSIMDTFRQLAKLYLPVNTLSLVTLYHLQLSHNWGFKTCCYDNYCYQISVLLLFHGANLKD